MKNQWPKSEQFGKINKHLIQLEQGELQVRDREERKQAGLCGHG
jgi:hypothetical protein